MLKKPEEEHDEADEQTDDNIDDHIDGDNSKEIIGSEYAETRLLKLGLLFMWSITDLIPLQLSAEPEDTSPHNEEAKWMRKDLDICAGDY